MRARWTQLVFSLLAAALLACGGGAGAPATSEAPAPSPAAPPAPAPAPAPVTLIAGVTTDNPSVRTADQMDALASLSRRVMARVVLDVGTPPSDYLASIAEIAKAAEVMAEPLDSSEMPRLSVAGVRTRIEQFIAILGDRVAAWEVGNEINGNWVGADPVAKVEAMFDAARSAGRRTALTLYYENPATPGFDMLPWIDLHIPAGHRLRSGLDYVFVSYYEDQNAGRRLTQAELDAIFGGLAQRFPNAKVGFGEFGWGDAIPSSDSARAEMIRRFYGYRVPTVPSYVGGGFYWHFRQTMAPKTRPDWGVLNEALGAYP